MVAGYIGITNSLIWLEGLPTSTTLRSMGKALGWGVEGSKKDPEISGNMDVIVL